MTFDIQIAHTVREIDQETWDALNEDQPFASHRWYRFGEAAMADEIPTYILLYHRDQLIARATLWLTKREPLPIPSKPLRRLLEALLRRWPLLICRSPLSNAAGLILPPPPLQEAALEVISEAALKQMRKRGASFLVFDYLEDHETRWPGWPQTLTPITIPDPGTYLQITWPDFESYLKQRSKSMRKDYRRHCNRAADLGVTVTAHSTVSSIDKARVLIRNVEQRHNSPSNPWARGVLENLDMADGIWLEAKIADQMVGCGLLLGDENTWFLALLGLDYSVRYVYFQLVYEAIRCAIERGVKVLRGGGGAYRMKERLGFQVQQDNYVMFASRQPMLQKLARRFATAGQG